jgi:hypothetical protein
MKAITTRSTPTARLASRLRATMTGSDVPTIVLTCSVTVSATVITAMATKNALRARAA